MKSSHVENLGIAKFNHFVNFVNLERPLFFISYCFDDFLLMRCSPYSSKIEAKSDLSSCCRSQLGAQLLLMEEDMATPLR